MLQTVSDIGEKGLQDDNKHRHIKINENINEYNAILLVNVYINYKKLEQVIPLNTREVY